MTGRTLISAGAALAIALAPAAARATTSCSFSSVVGVAFGTYDVFGLSPVDSVGSLTFTCYGVGSMDTIVIELSRGNASSFSPRQLVYSTYALSYNLFLDAARTAVWGDGTGGTSRYGPTNPPSGSPVTLSIYGRVPAGQNVGVGSYSDTIIATILF
jgi:spore coat protein U-like protein